MYEKYAFCDIIWEVLRSVDMKFLRSQRVLKDPECIRLKMKGKDMEENMKSKNGKPFAVVNIRVNEMKEPLGLDEKSPVFSWQFFSAENNMVQTKVQVSVRRCVDNTLFWDSGELETNRSIGITYAGAKLEPETRYEVFVKAWNQNGITAEGSTWFETGLLCTGKEAWEGAQWIGAPEYAVASDTIGVFVLHSTISMRKAGRAGIVFGANDWRLLDKTKNESLLEGKNYIRFVLDTKTLPAKVEIYRVGYAAADRADQPLFTLPAVSLATGKPLITEENRCKPHRLTVDVAGNVAYTCLDGERIGPEDAPVQLNPLGMRDVTTFPRLCCIGYYAGEETEAEFDGLHVHHRRTPSREFYTLEGDTLIGENEKLVDPSCHGLPMLRRSFSVKGRVAQARLYATARGIYECSINGQRVSEAYFAPGASQYDKHLMYQTFDVTKLLSEGENGIGCVLSSGWWSDSSTFFVSNYNYWGDRMSFLCKLVIRYEDGQREVLVTDTQNWQYNGEGPYRYAGFFNGEQYDARRADLYHNFSKIGFLSEDKKPPVVIEPSVIEEQEGIFPGAAVWPKLNDTEPKLVGNYQAPVKEIERITAKSVTEPMPGVYIYDLQQEIAGVPVLKFHEKRGTRVVIRYGEMLYPPLERYGELAGCMLQANLREASNTDIYICSGEEEEIYQPRFTFHGFRYIEISGVDQPPAPEDVQGILLSSVEKITGTFTCDHELLNRFVKNVCYSLYCNFISIPTDCPQRNERMGWMGDTHIFCRTANYQSNVKNFYLRNLQAMADMQTKDGRLPSIAPFGGGFGGLTYESAMILVVYELYEQYGDLQVIKSFYGPMKRWMEAVRRAKLPGITDETSPAWLGDWLAPEPCDDHLLWNAFHYRNARYMQLFAEKLHIPEDAGMYAREAERTKKYWNETFVDKESKRTRNADGSICDVQGSYSVGLSCDVFDEDSCEAAFGHLARKTIEGDYTIQTGFFGTEPINPMLSLGGYSDLAYRTMTQTKYPSWLYPVTQGATTIWERWNSFTKEEGFGENNSMNSFNHYSLGSVLNWLYENVLGIKRDTDYPGYEHFVLQPEIGVFGCAKGGIHTPFGKIESAWERREDHVLYTCTIPPNTSADVMLGSEHRKLGSGTYTLEIKI